MSDVTVAPSAPTTPAAPSNPPSAPAAPGRAYEVQINPNPVNSPNPMSSGGPPAPVGDLKGSPHRPPSRREAIQEAIRKATAPPEPPAAKNAPAKPAAKPEATPEPEQKLNLRQRPDNQTGPHRGEGGRFAPRPASDQPADGARSAGEGEPPADQLGHAQTPNGHAQTPKHPPLADNAPFREPPPRMNDAGKADWAGTPEAVRAEVHRMHNEFGQAFQRYRGDAEAFQPIRQYHEMARQQGTTLERAVGNYVQMEMKLRADPIGGLDAIVNNLNLKRPDGSRVTLRDVAAHVLNQSPEQHKLVAQSNMQSAQSHQIGQLHQTVNTLAQHLQHVQQKEQFRETRAAIDAFASQHPRFDELADLIQQELQLGFELPVAYRRAEMLRPASTAPQTRNTSAQTRPPATTDRSISGAPSSSAANASLDDEKPGKPRSRRDALANAIRHVNGRA